MDTAVVISPSEFLLELEAIVRRVVSEVRGAEPWLDYKGAASHLGMSPSAVQAASSRKQIPFHLSPLGQRRYRASELDEWVTESGRS